MKLYLFSFGAGVLVGVIYSLLNVRSPAPPVVALVGLAGILIGEQMIPVSKQMIGGGALTTAWQQAKCWPHVFGPLPGRDTATVSTTESTVSTTDSVEKRS